MTEPRKHTDLTAAHVKHPALTGLPPWALLVLYVILGLTPLILAGIQNLPVRSFWRELSSGLVMVGFAMLLVEFLLSGRFRPISGKVGIDLSMRFHQLAALMILAFIIAHPFLYVVPRLTPDPAAAFAALQRMFSSPGLRTGVIAWWLLIFFVTFAIWRDRLPIRYEIWRASHGLGAALIAILSLHHTLRVGTYSENLLLTSFWIGLTGIALLSLLYVYLLKPFCKKRAAYRIIANHKVADRLWRIVIEPQNGKALDFAAGQFVWANFGHSPFSLTEHPFSISSSPSMRPQLEFTIKESGDFTNHIGTIPVGTTTYLDGPHGAFTYAGKAAATRLVFIAGGVGFAPIMGILRQLRDEKYSQPVTLIYGNRVATQILYREELEAMKASLNLDLRLVLSEPPDAWPGLVGELSSEILKTCLEPIDSEAYYFACGPLPMMDSVETSLRALGVPANRIVSERFKYS